MNAEAFPQNGQSDPNKAVAPAKASLRDLPPSGWPRLRVLLRRSFARHCPECGGKKIFRNWLTMKDRCPRCDYKFEREHGYFLGAYPINLVFAEFITIAVMVAMLVWADVSWIVVEAVVIPLAIGLPLLFFPYARTLWMALDLYFTPENQL